MLTTERIGMTLASEIKGTNLPLAEDSLLLSLAVKGRCFIHHLSRFFSPNFADKAASDPGRMSEQLKKLDADGRDLLFDIYYELDKLAASKAEDANVVAVFPAAADLPDADSTPTTPITPVAEAAGMTS